MHSRITRNLAFLAAVSLLLVLFQARVSTGQATWIVDDDGPADFQTIQEAVNAADPGDTIEVSAGVYYEHVYVEKSLTFRGQNKYNTIVDGNGTGHAFWLVESNVNISGFTIRNGEQCAIRADTSGGHFFTDNMLLGNSYGIHLYMTPSGSTVVNNTFHSNYQVGIKVYESSNNNISNNYISHSTYGVKLDATSEYNSVVNNKILETSLGIYIGSSSNNNIDRNNVSGLTNGIYCLYSDHVNIRNNTFSKCADGVELYGTSNNTVSGNTIVKNGRGIYLVLAGSNTVDSNLVSNNYWGIRTYDSDSNNIIQNTFSYNTYCGIYLASYSTENTIALNNIIENVEQMFRDITSGANIWNTKISGKDYGNYWSDYEGEDTNGDGVGETDIPHLAVDNYPLMQPWSIIHDVATLSVTPSNDMVYQGQMVNITVVVRNEGTTNETFNVTAKYFNRIIKTETVTNLTRYESATLVFNWNTTGVPIDFDYEISAEAGPVAGETDMADNIFVDGTVSVEEFEEPHIPGDVNGDGIVDASDLFYLSKAYGTELGDDNWNKYCDFNGDNKVDFSDLSELNKNYGKTA